ncbi:hypothetical protein [Xanthomonas axonopodis]|uniref:hypothetical protein n=1 Tax=Xanthomonas axonopodis TaxID=53413 RepID=UPI0035571D97
MDEIRVLQKSTRAGHLTRKIWGDKVAIFSCLLLAAYACYAEPSPNVNPPSECQNFRKNGKDMLPVCGIALSRLIVNSNAPAGVRVLTFGYLSISNNKMAALYPAEDLVGRAEPFSCMEVPLTQETIKWDGAEERYGIYYVRVVGMIGKVSAGGSCAGAIKDAQVSDLTVMEVH